MDKAEFVKLVGAHVHHVTLGENLAGIRQVGLRRPYQLFETSKTRPIGPRPDPILLTCGNHTARLNHQRPLIAGRRSASSFLDDYTLESWAEQLDRRIFFWPGRVRNSFAKSLTDRGQNTVISLSSSEFFDRFKHSIDLAPINTGSATRRPSPRGDWIYVAVTQSVEDFLTNRIKRGLAKTRDKVVEVSLRADVPSETLNRLKAVDI
ncbi:MAG: hypothetical protein AAFZ91_05515 [Pseudomonadota bacterium]